MNKQQLLFEIASSHEFVSRVLRVFDEADSSYVPAEGALTVAQQVAHIAQTVEWFREGAARSEGFDLNFEEHMKPVMATTSLAKAREWMDRAFAEARAFYESLDEAELQAPLPEGMVMGGEPKSATINGIIDHTAHHRGSLSTYARCMGKVPPMPYMDAMPQS